MSKWSRRSRAILAIVALAGLGLAYALYRVWEGPAVRGYRVEPRPLVQTVVATGRVAAASRVEVGSEITGVVVERLVQEGDRVMPGDVLAVLRADELAADVREAEAALAELERSRRPDAQVALREAEARLAQAARETERRTRLFERNLLAREDVEQAEQAEIVARAAADRARLAVTSLAPAGSEEALLRARLASAEAAEAKTKIRTEVAGTVLTRDVEPGDLVQPGRVLFEIARSGTTELRVPVDEKNLEALALGQRALCITDAYPDRAFAAVVSFIAPRVDPAAGTIEVRLAVDPAPAYLREDMTVTVNVETGRREDALVVPNDALFAVRGAEADVYAVHEGRVQRASVGLGLRGLAVTEVTAGLAAGALVLNVPEAPSLAGRRVRVAVQPLPRTPAVRGMPEESAVVKE
jgi:HlyD family secretion protein